LRASQLRLERGQDSYDAKKNNGLTGLPQGGAGSATGRANAGAGEHDDRVEVSVEGMGLILGPAPLAEGTLVNEGEGTDFVCHNYIRCRIVKKVKLRKYRDLAAEEVTVLSNEIWGQKYD
jgi:hypothetical protein